MASKIIAEKPAPEAEHAGNLRGTKRTCQNEACGSRFYDLNRDQIECPICGTAYVLHVVAATLAPAAEPGFVRRTAVKPASVPGDDATAKAEPEDEVEDADLDEAVDVGLEIDDDEDADDEIEDVRGSSRNRETPE